MNTIIVMNIIFGLVAVCLTVVLFNEMTRK